MADESLEDQGPLSVGAGLIRKRKKVRKGTQSCWECRRRKIRCTFTDSSDSVCDGCKSRWTTCIKQDFTDEPPPSMQMAARLGRLEAQLEQLSQKVDRVEKVDASDIQKGPLHDLPLNRRIVDSQPLNSSQSAPNSSFPATSGPSTPAIGKYDGLCRALRAAWPSQHDLDLLLTIHIDTSRLYHGIVFKSYEKFFAQKNILPKDVLRLPPDGSHPVLLGRRLLMLSMFLQSIPVRTIQEELFNLSTDAIKLMARVFDTACRMVTSNDEIIGSVEGVECLMIESMYHSSSGNIRRAWLCTRRAITISQMLRLDDPTKWPSLRFLESESRERIDPEHMWFRMIRSDRYLSIMLGLSPASLDNSFGTPEILKKCTPMERLERLDVIAAARIAQRNSTNMRDLAATYEIDELLQKAASAVPPEWWAPPLSPVCGGSTASTNGSALDEFLETTRMINQFSHFSLQTRLHLPYILCPSTDWKYDYIKITAVKTSRELLSRFVSMRNDTTGKSMPYCRGVEFLAFVASTVICLAHVDANSQGRGKGSSAIHSFLADQRLADRELMIGTLEVMERMEREGKDSIAFNIASITRQLLSIEAETATAAANGGGNYYRASPSDYSDDSTVIEETNEDGLECGGRMSGTGKILYLYIPNFGTIKIERYGAGGGSGSGGTADSAQSSLQKPITVAANTVQVDAPRSLSAPESVTGSYCTGTSETSPEKIYDSQYHSDASERVRTSAPTIREQVSSSNGTQNAQSLASDTEMVGNMDDWALEGVDMTLFGSLIPGSEQPSGLEGENGWAWWAGSGEMQ